MAATLFELDGHVWSMINNYLHRIELIELQYETIHNSIIALKKIFTRHCIAVKVCSYGGPRFAADSFLLFENSYSLYKSPAEYGTHRVTERLNAVFSWQKKIAEKIFWHVSGIADYRLTLSNVSYSSA